MKEKFKYLYVAIDLEDPTRFYVEYQLFGLGPVCEGPMSDAKARMRRNTLYMLHSRLISNQEKAK